MSNEEQAFYEKRRQQFLSEEYYERIMAFLEQQIENELDETWFKDHYTTDETDEQSGESYRWAALSQQYWLVMSLHYTAGESIEQMGNEFAAVVDAREQEAKFDGLHHKHAPHAILGGGGISYLKPLQYIGLAYLLHRRDLLPRIATLMYGVHDPETPDDCNYEVLLRFNDPSRTIPDTHINDEYMNFQNALFEGNSKEEALSDLNDYLKEWYTLHDNHLWYNSHTHEDSYQYCGYWAYEAAAVVYLLDLDDTSLHKYLYYPKDLVAYARSKPSNSSPEPQPAPVIEPPPSRYTGYSVAVGEVCQEAGYFECPRMQGRIVMLMQGQPIAGETHNEMGEIIWYKLTPEAARDYLNNRKTNPLTGSLE